MVYSRPITESMMTFAKVNIYTCIIIVLKLSCTVIGSKRRTDEDVEPDYERLEYGGVWKKEVTNVSIYDEDIHTAYMHLITYLDSTGCVENMISNGINLYRVSNITKKVVQFTRSSHAPLYVQIIIPYADNNSFITLPVTFGSFITFHIEWRTQIFTQFHRIIVTNSQSEKFYIYSHTFHRIYYNPLNSTSICPCIVEEDRTSCYRPDNSASTTLSAQQILQTSELASSKTTQNNQYKTTRVKAKLEILRDQVNAVHTDLQADQVVLDERKHKADVETTNIKSQQDKEPVKRNRLTVHVTTIVSGKSPGETESRKSSDSNSKNSGGCKNRNLNSLSRQEKLNLMMNAKQLFHAKNEKNEDNTMTEISPTKSPSPDVNNKEVATSTSSESRFYAVDSIHSPIEEVLYYKDEQGREFEAVVFDNVIEIRSVSGSCMKPSVMNRPPMQLLYPNINQFTPGTVYPTSISLTSWKSFLDSLWMCLPQKEMKTGHGCCTVSALSYNIWFFNPVTDDAQDYIKRITKAGKILAESGADIIGLQEVRFQEGSGGELGPNQIDFFSSVLPQYQFVYQPAMMMSESLYNGRTEEGLAIFTKYHILKHDYILLFRNMSNSADLHQRICLHAEISIPGVGRVHVFNTHLSLSHEARERAVEQIVEYISKFTGPIILLGDLNAEPHEKSVRFLNDSKLVDIWQYLNGKRSSGNTFSALKEKRVKRVDYIFHLKEENTEILDVKLLDKDHSGNAAASDHLAVLATLGLNCPQKT